MNYKETPENNPIINAIPEELDYIEQLENKVKELEKKTNSNE